METRHNLWCATCKVTENLLKYSYSKKYNVQGYMCRECNRKRAKAYYNTPTGQANIYKANKKQWSTKEGYIKQRARQIVRYNITKGDIVRPKNCSKCNTNKTRIEAHHEDYLKPLEIIWLCTVCHSEADKQLREIDTSKEKL